MVLDLAFILVRAILVAAVWVLVWRFIEPRTQLLRVLRLAVFVACLLVVLAAMRLAGT
ncbi:MAG: hypothetical protein KBE04_05365 [Phycisphaerae bacterium]|nr:hypothetical protein [Phycisphaerae bacterium]